ncbi:MAG: PKD domain-containing protein [Anaerolineae bacterium]
MKRLIGATTLGLGLLLAVFLATRQSSAASPTGAKFAEIRSRHQTATLSDTHLMPRVSPPKPAHTTIDPAHYAGYVVLKLREGTQVRLRDDRLTSLVGADLAAVETVLARYPGLQPVRLFQRLEMTLDQERLHGQQRSGWQLADLNLYYALPMADAAQATQLADELNALDIVEIAYPEPLAEPADLSGSRLHGDKGLGTPSFVASQGYLSSTVTDNGIDAVYAWTLPGGTGTGVKFIDIEYSWQTTHEDLISTTRFYSGGTWYDDGSYSLSNHGTAVLGEIVADNDITGVTGIAYDAQYGVRGVYGDWLSAWPSVAGSLNAAAAQLSAGDIILIELHNPTSSSPPGERCDGNCGNCTQFGYIAMEYWQANFDAIQNAAANGIIVVEAAGNGAMNFDNPFYGSAFDRSQRDSGAIIVGAGLSGVGANTPVRKPECWSNYGSAVDIQGWGDSIWTLGYGTGWTEGSVGGDPSDRDQWYANSFGGTSGASPIVVGAAASINGMRKAAGLPVLTPLQMRSLLRNTGTAQARDHKQVGPLPNLRPASDGLFHTVVLTDAWGNGNGTPEPGERGLLLDISLEALGIITYTNASATLTSTVSGLTILTPTNIYPTLTPTSGASIRSFAFDLADSVSCGITLPFTLSVTTDQGPYTATFSLQTKVLGVISTTFTSTDAPQAIPDGSGNVTSYITITQDIAIGDLDATVWITHPHVYHLRGALLSPSGHSIWLMNRAGAGALNNDYVGTIFDDEAIASVRNASFPATGHYRPEDWLSDFDGRTISGTWRLQVDDQSSGYTGTLNGWSLTVTPLACASRASPTATKTGPDLIGPNQLFTYTLTMTNPGGLPLYNVVVTETYDTSTTYQWADPPPTSGNNVWRFSRLTSNSTQLITITVQVGASAPDHTVLTNTAQINADDISPITVTETTTVLHPQFSIAKQAASDPAQSFRPFTYTLTISNSGGSATSVVITDALPAGANYVSGGSYAGGVVTWSGLTVPASDTLDVTFVVTACTGPLVNSAYRVATCAEGVSSPWGAPVTTPVQVPNLVAAFTPVSTSIAINATVVFTETSATDGGPIVAWGWDFGDGETGSGQVVSHTYAAAGDHTVMLAVTDTCGYTDTVQVIDAVRVRSRLFLPLVLRNSP